MTKMTWVMAIRMCGADETACLLMGEVPLIPVRIHAEPLATALGIFSALIYISERVKSGKRQLILEGQLKDMSFTEGFEGSSLFFS